MRVMNVVHWNKCRFELLLATGEPPSVISPSLEKTTKGVSMPAFMPSPDHNYIILWPLESAPNECTVARASPRMGMHFEEG